MATKKAASAEKPAAPTPQADHPTVAEARAMFEQRPDLAAVVTTEGVLTRDSVQAGRTLGLDGVYR
jgi:hypothetical protein